MTDRENVVSKLDELRQFADTEIHPIVSPDNWYVYSKLCDLIDLTKDDVLALLKEQETKEQCLKTKCIICPHCDNCDVDENGLLKEQKTKYPVCEKCGKEIEHINTSVFNHDGSDSDYSIPITYDKESRCVTFSTSQNWTGYSLTDEERKEDIRCPYCGKFPFDDSIEIEFYEPVEVMMWTSEGR